VLLSQHVAPTAVRLNQTHPDLVWQKVVRDVRFRKALNMAINREEIIDAVYFGFASLPQSVPSVYDPAKANQLLDEMGLNRRDAESYRLGPDGKTFVIPFEIAKHAADIVPVTELVVEHWKKVGIKATIKTIDPGLQDTRRMANELKADIMWHHGPELWWGALWDYGSVSWGRLWDLWRVTGGKEGEEPPEVAKRFVDLVEQSIVVSPEKRQEIVKEYRRLLYENIFIMMIVEKAKYSLIVSERLGNVPHRGFAITTNFAAEQLFFRR